MNYKIREFKLTDLENGFIETIRNINPTNLTPDSCLEYYNRMKALNPSVTIYVLENDLGIVSNSFAQLN